MVPWEDNEVYQTEEVALTEVWRQQNGFCVGTGVSLAVIRDKARGESRQAGIGLIVGCVHGLGFGPILAGSGGGGITRP